MKSDRGKIQAHAVTSAAVFTATNKSLSNESPLNMGVNHGTSPPEVGVGDANANCPSALFTRFRISSKHQIVALLCCKNLTNPTTLTAYSPLPESTSSPNHHLRRKIQHFSGEVTDQKYGLELTKTRHFNRKIHFSSRETPQLSLLDPPMRPRVQNSN